MRLIWLAIFNLIACSTNDQAEKIGTVGEAIGYIENNTK